MSILLNSNGADRQIAVAILATLDIIRTLKYVPLEYTLCRRNADDVTNVRKEQIYTT